MTWSRRFRIRESLRGSLWLIPLLGALLGAAFGALVSLVDEHVDLRGYWRYSPATASTVLTSIVGATAALTGFVVTVTVLVVQMATGTFSARYMRLWYAGFEFVLGAFAAGLVVGLALESPEGAVVRMRLEGIGFGFLVPIYFVVTGMHFDLDSLLSATGLALAALFLGLLLVTRGTPALLWLRELGARQTRGLALYGSTGLPLIVAIVGIGTERGAISTAVGASLIGAGMMSVLLYPILGTRIAGRAAAAGRVSGESDEY